MVDCLWALALALALGLGLEHPSVCLAVLAKVEVEV